jgi:type IX secretion system PorP/SprF family membrane protein
MKQKLRIAIRLISVFFIFTNSQAQDYPVFKEYYLSPFTVNPAFTGKDFYPEMILSVKKQWLGIPDAPVTSFLSAQYRIGKYDFYDPKGLLNKGPLKIKERIGLGAALYHDVNGPDRYTGGNISYAFHSSLRNNMELSLGISVTASSYSFKSEILNPDQPDDPYLINGNENLFKMNFNIGTLLTFRKGFIGLSAARILKDIKHVNDNNIFQPGYFLMMGKTFVLSKNLSLVPSLTLKKIGTESLQADIFTKLYIKKYHWIALSAESTGNLDFTMSIHALRTINIGYSYEYTVSKIAQYNFGSHHLFIIVNLRRIVST